MHREDPRSAGLVRYAKRLADRLHGPWMALYIEGRRAVQLSEEERDRIADTLRLAQSLGGEAVTLPAGDRNIADDVIGYAPGHVDQRYARSSVVACGERSHLAEAGAVRGHLPYSSSVAESPIETSIPNKARLPARYAHPGRLSGAINARTAGTSR